MPVAGTSPPNWAPTELLCCDEKAISPASFRFGLLAWDVNRLIELTARLPQIEVPLDSIREMDEPFWFGGGSAAATCRAVADHARLIFRTDLRCPVISRTAGRVMEGMHRVAKAYLEGRATILTVRLEVDPEPDFVGVGEEDLPYEEGA